MSNIRRTAQGKSVDIDSIRMTNEETIAIGNMKTNARGDELGPGGQIVKTKAEVMRDYYNLNSPVADDTPLQVKKGKVKQAQQAAEEAAIAEAARQAHLEKMRTTPNTTVQSPRGELAASLAEVVEVKQELLTPAGKRNPDEGPSRI
jgi:hypothetical protein